MLTINAQILVIIFFTSLGVSLFAIPLAARLAPYMGLVDHPGGRKIHTVPIPRSGGIALFFSIVIGIIVGFWVMPQQTPVAEDQEAKVLILLVGILGATAIGLADDLLDLRPTWKFGFQALLASSFALLAYRFNFLQVPGFSTMSLTIFNIPFTAFWIMALMNGFNFMDGVDGLAGSVSLVVYGGIGVAAYLMGDATLFPLCFAVLGALVAFLFYNRTPAMVYLGDAGANVLGFGAAAALLSLGQTFPATFKAANPDPAPFHFQVILDSLIVGYPFLEVTLSTIRRGIKKFYFGRSMEWSEKEHIHHRLLQLGLGPLAISALASSFNLLLAIAALLVLSGKHALAVFCVLPLVAGAPLLMTRLGFFEFLNAGSLVLNRPYFQMAHHFVEMQKAKLQLVSNQVEVLALASQTCAEFGAQSFWIKAEPGAVGKGGLVYYWKVPKYLQSEYRPHHKPDATNGNGNSEVFRDRVSLENDQIEAYWTFAPTQTETELDVEYRVLVSGFMKNVLGRIRELKNEGNGKRAVVVNNLVHAKVRSSLLKRRYHFKNAKEIAVGKKELMAVGKKELAAIGKKELAVNKN